MSMDDALGQSQVNVRVIERIAEPAMQTAQHHPEKDGDKEAVHRHELYRQRVETPGLRAPLSTQPHCLFPPTPAFVQLPANILASIGERPPTTVPPYAAADTTETRDAKAASLPATSARTICPEEVPSSGQVTSGRLS